MADASVSSLLASTTGQIASGVFSSQAAKAQTRAAKAQATAQTRVAEAQERAAKARADADLRIAAAQPRSSKAPWFIAGGATLAVAVVFGIIYLALRKKKP